MLRKLIFGWEFNRIISVLKKIGVIICFILLTVCSEAMQISDVKDYPEVGKTCPDFVLHNIKYYPFMQRSLEDLKGKWVVLDFWNTHCGACITSFPKMSALAKEFEGKVEIIEVGIQDKEGQIENMFERFRKKENLITPCAFDSALANQWDIYTCPDIVLIDPFSIVRARISSISREDLKGFLSGNAPKLRDLTKDDSLITFDKKRIFLIDKNGGNDTAFYFRSLLSSFDSFKQPDVLPQSITDNPCKGRFQVLGSSLNTLYNYAYYGKSHPNVDSGYNYRPILEVTDSTIFKYSYDRSENLFCYSLIVPQNKADKEYMQKLMQRDLENYFGYTATIESRNFSCFKIVATKKAAENLRTKGGPSFAKEIIPKIQITCKNISIHQFIAMIKAYTGVLDIINDTNINKNIDIEMNCILTDIDDVKTYLHEKGLDLIPSRKIMKVLVIRDVK